MMRREIAPILMFLAGLSGCADRVAVTGGAAGPALPPGTTVTLIGTDQNANPLAMRAQDAVVAALVRHGHPLGEGGGHIEVGLTERQAMTGIAVIDGAVISPAKGRKLLQSCRDRTFRLAVTYYGSGATVPVTRAWAEERRCKGTIDESIAALADKAVAALAAGTPPLSAAR